MSRWSSVAPPNILSFSRVLLAAAFPFSDDHGRLALVGAAAATDFLDGWIARQGNWATRAGALIDPIADRVFAVTAVGTFLVDGQLTVAQFFTMLLRDIMTAVGFVVARIVPWLRAVEFRARFLGKLVTTVQLLALLAILVAPQAVNSAHSSSPPS